MQRGAREGVAFAAFLLFVQLLIAPFEQLTLPLTSWSVIPRGLAFGLGFAVAGACMRGLKPTVGSLYGTMLLFMLCLVPVLLGLGLMLAGWRPAALFPLVLAFPIGAMCGFIDWYNLYRNARPKRIPPSA